MLTLALENINFKTIRYTAEEIFCYLRKNDEKLELVIFQSYLEKLPEVKYLKSKGSNDNETFTITKKLHLQI